MFFHNLTVQSLEHDAIKVPIGFIETSFIDFLCPMNFIGLERGFKFHNNKFPSSLPVNICFLYF